MSVNRYFVRESLRKQEIDEFLAQELKRAGYSRCEIAKTPLGTNVVIYAARPGMVIGRRGQSIRDLTRILEEKFKLENPQISVAPVDVPELDPKVVAGQIASALERGVHFRRAAYWALRRVMEAGALGAEITVSGKLTTERARYEKYREGYLPKSGDPVMKQLRTAVAYVQLKPGIFGVKVSILPPEARFPDRPSVKEAPQVEEEPREVRVTEEAPTPLEEAKEPAPVEDEGNKGDETRGEG
ncbi:MAG: 30S ribosomal protein S3 [Candidatus Bathyarchaeia archaeon]|nr:30S ribosomal protein S3 [Candidatus Bathyarchaeota archaeon]